MDDVKIGEILLPGDEDTQKRQEETIRAKFWPTMKRAFRRIPFARDVVAAFFCATDTQTPIRVRGILLAAIAYFVMPFDVVPDVFALIGFSDDIAVLTGAIALIGNHINQRHYDAADKALAENDLSV